MLENLSKRMSFTVPNLNWWHKIFFFSVGVLYAIAVITKDWWLMDKSFYDNRLIRDRTLLLVILSSFLYISNCFYAMERGPSFRNGINGSLYLY